MTKEYENKGNNINSEEESINDAENLPKKEIDTENDISEDLQITDDEELDETIQKPENNSLNEVNLEGEISQEIDTEIIKEQLRDLQKNLVEAALYAAGIPLNIEEISIKLEFSKKIVEELVKEIAYDYLERSGALIIAQVGDRYQMQIRPEYIERVSKFAKGGGIAERYLRTLTVIALKQPILKSTVVKLRGSGAYEHVKYLLDNDLISAVKKGRTHELTTTDKYADMFGLPKNKEELRRSMIKQLGLETDQK
jgi:segregation and condensation protein B